MEQIEIMKFKGREIYETEERDICSILLENIMRFLQ